MNSIQTVSLPAASNPSRVVDGINIYDRADYNESFEEAYTTNAEPWEYSHRAAELLRHQYSVQQIRRYKPSPQNLLELGCSKGLMTELLIPFTGTVHAADISLTAIKACKLRCDAKAVSHNCHIKYYITTVPGLPFEADSFDVVTICDGLTGWYLSDDQKRLALLDVHRVLKKGGIAILTDYLMPEYNKGEFESYQALVRQGPLLVEDVSFLYDKPWYKLESLLKKTGTERKASKVLANIPLARMLNKFGRFLGKKAARHILIVVRKE